MHAPALWRRARMLATLTDGVSRPCALRADLEQPVPQRSGQTGSPSEARVPDSGGRLMCCPSYRCW
jgi:hypothetical protein